jgi:hypothetical protein
MTGTSSSKISVRKVKNIVILEVPDWWSKKSRDDYRRTRTILLHERNTEKRPHETYDLDGDGAVD